MKTNYMLLLSFFFNLGFSAKKVCLDSNVVSLKGSNSRELTLDDQRLNYQFNLYISNFTLGIILFLSCSYHYKSIFCLLEQLTAN